MANWQASQLRDAYAARRVALVDDVEAMAGRTGVGAGPAAEAPPRGLLPERGFIAAARKSPTAARSSCGGRVLGQSLGLSAMAGDRLAGEQRLPFSVRQRTSYWSASACGIRSTSEPRVSLGPEPTDVQKQSASYSRQASVTTVVNSRRRL